MKRYDVIIMGAGVVGCATARALSRFRLNALVLEAEADVASGATKANSGIVHAGYDCVPGTLKARFNVEGAEMYRHLAQELDIPYRACGAMVLCFREADEPQLQALYERGLANGVPGLRLLTAAEARQKEPNLSDTLHAALWAETAAVVSPYEAAIAFAENAAENSVAFLLEAPVLKVAQESDGFVVETPQGTFAARALVNAAGINADVLHEQVASQPEPLGAVRGQYYLLDKAHGDFVRHTLFQLPDKGGKGVLISPTAEGNVLVGPNAEALPRNQRENRQTTPAGLAEVLAKAGLSVKGLPVHGRITAFAGVRGKHASDDFVLNQPVPGFFNALGVDSPGLSAAPALGVFLAGRVAKHLDAVLKPEGDFKAERRGIPRFAQLSFDAQAALIASDARYASVVCRCETVTEAEIRAAIQRPVGARNLDALKRRVRAQMGRCQGGFCSLKLAEILAEELGVSEESLWA